MIGRGWGGVCGVVKVSWGGRGRERTTAISATSASRCCSKYVFSPAAANGGGFEDWCWWEAVVVNIAISPDMLDRL